MVMVTHSALSPAPPIYLSAAVASASTPCASRVDIDMIHATSTDEGHTYVRAAVSSVCAAVPEEHRRECLLTGSAPAYTTRVHWPT